MNDFNFDEWFYCTKPDKLGFWQRYAKKYLGTVQKGSPSKTLETAERAMKNAIKAKQLPGLPKIDTPEEFARACDLALEEQKRYHDQAKAANKFVPNFQKVETWFNQRGWEYSVGSFSELKDRPTPSHKPAPKRTLGTVTNIEVAKENRAKLKSILGK